MIILKYVFKFEDIYIQWLLSTSQGMIYRCNDYKNIEVLWIKCQPFHWYTSSKCWHIYILLLITTIAMINLKLFTYRKSMYILSRFSTYKDITLLKELTMAEIL